jgi:hypothetical protein
MDKFRTIIHYLRGVESVWSKQDGRLTLLGLKVKDGRICISEDDAYRIYGIRNFGDFWRTSSPINAYRVYKENEKVYVEFEGNRGQITSYLYVGAFAYHMKRIRVATDELEKVERELTTEILEWGKRNSHGEEARNAPATEEQILEVEEEWDEEEWDGEEEEEEEEELPRKMMRMRKVFWGVCRTSEYDPETMEPYPRCDDKLKRMLSEKGLVAYLLKNRDEDPDSEDDRRMIPTGNKHLYENVPHENEYENTFNITENY